MVRKITKRRGLYVKGSDLYLEDIVDYDFDSDSLKDEVNRLKNIYGIKVNMKDNSTQISRFD